MASSKVLGSLAVMALVVACSSSSNEGSTVTTPAEEPVPTEPAPAETADASADAAPTEQEIDLLGCKVKRVADPEECAEDCEARLLLPKKNGSYCTIACAKDEDCGGTLVCPETIGACVPKCTTNAECTTRGFARCDSATGACDTI